MKEFNNYFIVGTNSDALHDTMNGIVTGKLIMCKDCKYFTDCGCVCMAGMVFPKEYSFCSKAERKESGK